MKDSDLVEIVEQAAAALPRLVKYLVIHCSAGHYCDDSGLFVCHLYISRDGSVRQRLPLESEGCHAKAFNRLSIGICYEGGTDDNGRPADTRTAEQRQSLTSLVRHLKESHPGVAVVGHNQLMAYTRTNVCPAFDVGRERW